MASAGDKLYELFLEIAGEPGGEVGPVVLAGRQLAGTLQDVTRQIASVVVPQAGAAAPVAPAIAAAAGAASSSGGGGVGAVLESVASTVFKNALGAAPLIRGLVSLFGGGGDDDKPEPLVKFALPPSVRFTAADTASGFRQVDYDQQGLPRVFGQEADAPVRREAAQQVTVNVQAMDARSFLDRSGEIAAAVREAMLHMNSINDVVSDL